MSHSCSLSHLTSLSAQLLPLSLISTALSLSHQAAIAELKTTIKHHSTKKPPPITHRNKPKHHKVRITYSIKNLNPLSPCKTMASSKRLSLNPEVFGDGEAGSAMAEAMRVAEESVVGLRWRELDLVAASFPSPQTFSLIAQTSLSSCPAKASRWWRVGP